MKNNLLIIFALSLSLFLFSCDSDDENVTTPGGIDISGTITTPSGNSFTISDADGSEKYGREEMFDKSFQGSNNLDGGFFKTLRFITDKGSLRTRIHFPNTYKPGELDWRDAIQETHSLYPFLWNLQDTQGQRDIVVTLFFTSGDYADQFLEGTISFKRDWQSAIGVYSLYGEIDAENDNVSVEGIFWSKDFSWN
ncbi:MAG: hypothetical protein Kapaf2KO_03350 [Candidatus Kapaibacteriales bacterium]